MSIAGLCGLFGCGTEEPSGFLQEFTMKLIIIHGPPAAGKLTVAREVERLAGTKVFHNHLSNDCVSPIFGFGTPSFQRLVEKIRREVFDEAVREDIDLIFTVCYGKTVDDAAMQRLVEPVEAAGGDVGFVLLVCDPADLEKRVVHKDRGEFRKIRSVEGLRKYISKFDFYSPVPGRETLRIDTTETTSEETARQIIAQFGLDQ